MGTNLSINKRILVGKLETTPGSIETLADADFDCRVRDIEIAPTIEMDNENSKYANGNHSEDYSLAGSQLVTIKFSVRATWGGAVATAPDWWKFAKMCGATTVAYTTTGIGLVGRNQHDDQTGTIYVIDQEIGEASPVYTIYKCAGCMGEMTIGAEKPGAPWMANFEMKGKLVDVVDGATLALTSPQTTLGEIFLSNVCTINSGAKKISSFQFKTGNTISPLLDQSDATGVSHYIITERRPRLSVNPLAVKQATTDWLALTLAQTAAPITIATAASTPHFTLKGILCQPISTSLANREGLVAWEQNYKLLVNGTPASLSDTALTYEDTWELLQGARA